MKRFLLALALPLFAAAAQPAEPGTEPSAIVEEAVAAALPLVPRLEEGRTFLHSWLLVSAARCDEALALFRADGTVFANTAQVLAQQALVYGDPACATEFARLMHSRRVNPGILPVGHPAYTYRAGAILRRAGQEAEGSALIAQAEAELAALGQDAQQALWSERLQALMLYDGTPLFTPWLDRLAPELVRLRSSDIESSAMNSFMAYLVREGRREEARAAMATRISRIRDIAVLERMAASFSPDACAQSAPATRQALEEALGEANEALRVSKLTLIASQAAHDRHCRRRAG